MKKTATFSFLILVVLVSACYMPRLYGLLFFGDIEKTHLFYSPSEKTFIFKEKIVGPAPTEAIAKAEDHHSEIAYCDAAGNYMSRVEFEKKLPFIYYKNMELWGLLPIEIDGRSFTKKDIKKDRRVIELRSDQINNNAPAAPVWPLLESTQNQVRLVFPDDRFRMTDTKMEFINADTNRIDEELTKNFTASLNENGFIFPARSVNGKFTVLKPFDEGVFIVDKGYQIFHVKRVNGEPSIKKLPVPSTLKTRHIRVSENRQKKFYGLLLCEAGDLYLVSYNNYKLIPLPLKDYNPDRMDLKLIFNPLYVTAVYSDRTRIYAVAMNKSFNVVDRFSHKMSKSKETFSKTVFKILFPFQINFGEGGNAWLKPDISLNGWPSIAGIGFALAIYLFTAYFFRIGKSRLFPVALILLTGLYGATALLLNGLDA